MRLAGRLSTTINGQITLLVLSLLVLAFVVNLTTVYFYFDAAVDRSRSTPPPGAVFSQMATLIRLADEQKSEDQLTKLLDDAGRAGFNFSRLTPKEMASIHQLSTEDGPPRSFEFGPGRPLFEQIDPGRVVMRREGEFVARLRDGSALSFSFPVRSRPMLPGFFVGPLFYTLIIVAILIVGLSIYAVRSITSPLSSFAAVAQAIGRGAYNQSVKEQGPQEVVKVARALNDMRDKIRTMIEDRTSMLFAISHDLRTPLTRLRLRAEKLPPDQSNGLLADIERMEKMLGETLQFLRGDTLAERATPTDLASVLNTICTEMSDLGRNVSYDGPGKFVLVCQPVGISRAITNLVENAVKYGSHVDVRLRADNSYAVIDVSDDGPGIPFSYRKQVFEPFFKIDSARTMEINPGFGLGLSIARRIVGAHGGEIELLDNVPRGTKVRIRLPIQIRSDQAATPEGVKRAALGTLHG